MTATPSPTPTIEALPTETPQPCLAEGGEWIEFEQNASEIADGENLRYRVYIPPCYFQSQKRYPLVILLHGLSYREQQWDEIGVDEALDAGILSGRIAPMVIVNPYMGTIGQVNAFPPAPSYESVITEELLPTIERNFCIWQDSDHRAIGGISRGGFWAYSIAMRNPDLFGIVGGHSAYFPGNLGEVPAAFNPLEIATDSSYMLEADLRMYMDNGAADSSGPSQQIMSNRLSERGIAHTYQVHAAGQHDNDYWASHVSEYLQFYGDPWPKNVDDLPSCAEASP
jgi:enterochelin esterase-like enzyme